MKSSGLISITSKLNWPDGTPPFKVIRACNQTHLVSLINQVRDPRSKIHRNHCWLSLEKIFFKKMTPATYTCTCMNSLVHARATQSSKEDEWYTCLFSASPHLTDKQKVESGESEDEISISTLYIFSKW
jgi:hypothetical protein